VNGLQLLESGAVESLRAQVTALEKERDAAKAGAAKAAESVKTAKEQVSDAKEQAADAKSAARELRSERSAHGKTKSELEQARIEMTTIRQALESAQSELQRYGAAMPTAAYCRECDKFVPGTEWAEQVADGGAVHVYHNKHEYRPKGTIMKWPTVMFWRGGPR
jgi:predicted RNase H-like nuclease (RuvC/YqgF family)